ncbi:MAG: nucleotidyl transferase AbiEii/AbiGii toxin family protein [Planctomycetia bacterium]
MRKDVLPPVQQACLAALGPVADSLGFHLAGGTAVAIHLGHRQSIDFDWFTRNFPFEAAELSGVLHEQEVDFQVTSLARRTVHGESAGVRVSFLEFRVPLLQPLVSWPEFGCRLAALDDLAAMKLLAVSQRGTKKDFVDVNALATRFSLAEMLDGYRRKFGVTDVTRVLAGLCYFDDAEPDPMPTMVEPMEWDSVKASLRRLVATFARP